MRRLNLFSSDSYQKELSYGSPSASIARNRNMVYDEVINNFHSIKNRVKQLGLFSSASVDLQDNQLGVTLKEASVKAYLNSFAGYIALERPLSQMTELLVYKDMITKGTGKVVLPMLGEQLPREAGADKQQSTTKTSGSSATSLDFDFDLGAVVPGSINIKVVVGDTSPKIYRGQDNRAGEILISGGILSGPATIDYSTGVVDSTINVPNSTEVTTTISYAVDSVASLDPSVSTRIKPKQNYYLIKAKVNKFDYEYDLILDSINSKTLGSGFAEDMKLAVKDEHQESINNALVTTLIDNYVGSNLTIDLSSFVVSSGYFDSLLKVFKSGLVAVDTEIAKHTYKIIAASAYVVGTEVGDLFCALDSNYDWVANNSGFVNGLLGFYKGRAVLRHLGVSSKSGYAIHKPIDGTIAPLGLGILLPATDLPFVGNYNNSSEIAGGIYSIEGVTALTNDLVQKFTVEFPDDWNIVS